MQKNTENINPAVLKTSNGKIMDLSRCDIYGCKKPRFVKKQEASGTLSSLGLKTPLSKIQYCEIFCSECNSIEKR